MHKWLVILIFVLNINILVAQSSPPDKWKKYVQTTKIAPDLNKDEPVSCLLKLPPGLKRSQYNFKVIRSLDKTYAIVLLPISEFNKMKTAREPVWFANNNWKLGSSLNNTTTEESGKFIVQVSNPVEFKNKLQETNHFTIEKEQGNTFIIRGPGSEVKSLLINLNEVQYIGHESLHPHHEAKIQEMDLSVNAFNLLHHRFPSLTGNGLIISIKDNMFDSNDLDLRGKYINTSNSSGETDAHATAMGTLSAGLGNSSIKGKGVAFESSLASSDYNNLLPDLPEQLAGTNIYTQNHSYGTEIENFYGALAESYDNFCYQNPNVLHVFSSGNKGESIPSDGQYAGLGTYSNLSGNFKMAKNTICIGATDQYNQVMFFSSRGPAFDGRIKPEVVAFSTAGTSNSTALVSGLAALLQQQYTSLYGSHAPSSLLKACLINSAVDIAPTGPDYLSGFGAVDANASLTSLTDGHFILDQITDNQTKNYNISIPANVAELKITLVWTDAPAPVNSNIALINDLDLRLIAPDLSAQLPWILDPTPNIENITAAATRGADHLNNVEQITATAPTAGTYTIEVHGFDVSTASQSFALVYEWKTKNAFDWSYPTGSDAATIGESSLLSLRWNSTYTAETGELSVSYDEGNSWQSIDNQVDLNKKIYDWYPDNNINYTCRLKMKVAGTEYLSDTFVVARETNVRVVLDCEENIELTWNENSNAALYEIYNLQNNKMLPIATTTHLNYIFKKNEYPSPFFAVEPVYAFEIPAQRSEAIDYNAFGASCYFNSFYALGKNDEAPLGLELYLELGSIYLLQSIELYRIIENEPLLITQINQPDKNNYNYLDINPQQGRNLYQAKLILNDGTEYLSEIIDLIFLSEKAYLVFPNPTNSSGLNIYTKNFGNENVVFKLFDTRGKQILSKKLNSDREHLDLQTIKNGTYIYRIESSDGIIESSVLIVQ